MANVLTHLLGDSTRIQILATLIDHNQIYRDRLANYSGVDSRRVDLHVTELAEIDIVDRQDDVICLNKDNDVVQNLADLQFAFSEYLQGDGSAGHHPSESGQ